MGKNGFALVKDKINLFLVSRQFKLFKKLKKTLLLAQTLKMCFFRVNSQNYARPCAATEKATLIKKWDFGIGVLKKCGPTCSNFCPSKISPPYSVSMCVSPLTNTSSMCVYCVVALGSYTNQYMLPHRVAISLCTDILYLYLGISLCLQGGIEDNKSFAPVRL